MKLRIGKRRWLEIAVFEYGAWFTVLDFGLSFIWAKCSFPPDKLLFRIGDAALVWVRPLTKIANDLR